MKNYTKNLTWAVVSMLDRSTQDDNKSKVQIAETLQLSERQPGMVSRL